MAPFHNNHCTANTFYGPYGCWQYNLGAKTNQAAFIDPSFLCGSWPLMDRVSHKEKEGRSPLLNLNLKAILFIVTRLAVEYVVQGRQTPWKVKVKEEVNHFFGGQNGWVGHWVGGWCLSCCVHTWVKHFSGRRSHTGRLSSAHIFVTNAGSDNNVISMLRETLQAHSTWHPQVCAIEKIRSAN